MVLLNQWLFVSIGDHAHLLYTGIIRVQMSVDVSTVRSTDSSPELTSYLLVIL